MKRVATDEQLLARLARFHEMALATDDTQLATSRSRFRRRLRERAWRNRSVGGVSESTVTPGWRWPLAARWAAVAGAVAVGALVLWSRQTLHRSAKVQVDPERISSASNKAPAVTASLPPDSCAARVSALGNEPLIDDFEDHNPLIASFEGRVGLWALFRDSDSPGTFNTITPSLLPKPNPKNRYALHVVGGEMLNWGAAIQFSFQPACYDASAYSGVSLRAKGPGRIFVGMREMSVVSTSYGGTCKSDCYNTHQKKLDLARDWRSYVVPWSEMRQRGYGAKPLDSTRVNGLSIVVQASDTPFDLWIDDVRFVTR